MPVWTRCLNQILHQWPLFVWWGYPWQKCMGKVSQSTHFSPYRLFCIKGYYKLREFLEAWSYFKVFSLPTMPWHCVFLCIGCCCYYFHWCRDEKQTSTVYGGWHFRWNLKKKEKKKQNLLLGWGLKVVLPLKDVSIQKIYFLCSIEVPDPPEVERKLEENCGANCQWLGAIMAVFK